jgi:hypothetical protein
VLKVTGRFVERTQAMTLEEQLEIVGSKIKGAIAAIDRMRIDSSTRDVIQAEINFVRRILVEANKQPRKKAKQAGG